MPYVRLPLAGRTIELTGCATRQKTFTCRRLSHCRIHAPCVKFRVERLVATVTFFIGAFSNGHAKFFQLYKWRITKPFEKKQLQNTSVKYFFLFRNHRFFFKFLAEQRWRDNFYILTSDHVNRYAAKLYRLSGFFATIYSLGGTMWQSALPLYVGE